MARWMHSSVVYLHLTDNSEVGKFGTMVSFHHRERGHHHGTDPIVLRRCFTGVDLLSLLMEDKREKPPHERVVSW
jgi:hypothetical protein